MSCDLKEGTQDSNTEDVGSVTQSGTLTTGQKRLRDDHGAPASKKAHIVDSEENVQVKILIPSSAVGAIIGKGGETMRHLKSESGCRLQMSKNLEVYHGTNERICLVKGRILSVMKVVEVVLEKIKDKVDPNTPADIYDHKGVDRTKEMKLLVPNTSAGMVIGKSGARIKEIRDQTGANIQVYPKAGSAEAKVSQERVITIAAEESGVLLSAMQRVLEKVAADPQHASSIDHKDVDGSYMSRVQHSVQPFDFSRNSLPSQTFSQPSSQFISSASQQVWQPPQQQRLLETTYGNNSKEGYSNGSSNQFKLNPMQGLGNQELLAFLDSLQSTLRTSGFNEASVQEVMQAMQVLAKYNIMGLGLGLGVAAMAQIRSTDQPPSRYEPTPHLDNPERHYLSHIDSKVTSPFTGLQPMGGVGGVLIDVMSQSKTNANTHNFASTVIKEKLVDNGHVELEVPDAIVGAVLGPKAKTLAEIQHLSGCKVEVHKRGSVTAQGNRLISLSGESECIRNGRLMIEKVINDEQARRNQQAHHNRSTFL